MFLLDNLFLQAPDSSSCPRCPPLLRGGPFSPPAHTIVQLTAPAGRSQPWPPCRLGLPRSQSQPALPLSPFPVICPLPPFLCGLLSLSHADPCLVLHFSSLFSTRHRLATFFATLSKTVGRSVTVSSAPRTVRSLLWHPHPMHVFSLLVVCLTL